MVKCFICGKEGHFKGECPNKNNFTNGLKNCYDCGEFATDIKSHHSICKKSKYQKSSLISSVSSSINPNNIQNFSNCIDFYFLIDVSGSMSGNRLNSAKNCALSIVDCMKESDRMSIISFDTNAYFKLKPRPVGQIIRQKELPDILNKIFAQGMTALYDAIHLSLSQIQNKTTKSIIFVLTDGEDNSSKHTYQQILDMMKEFPNIELHIIHIDGKNSPNLNYRNLCESSSVKGKYLTITEDDIELSIKQIFKTSYIDNIA